jgi:hypothetical protein
LNASGDPGIFAARAWVNFNGTTNVGGFCTIRASGNVTSITDNGSGDYTVNFTTAMPDANYVGIGVGGVSLVALGQIVPNSISSASTFRFQNSNNSANIDSSQIMLAFFR